MTVKQQLAKQLRTEAERLLKRIKEFEKNSHEQWPSSRMWSAVKRASLDLNVVGAKCRKL